MLNYGHMVKLYRYFMYSPLNSYVYIHWILDFNIYIYIYIYIYILYSFVDFNKSSIQNKKNKKLINQYLDHLMMKTGTLILGDFNAHRSSLYSRSTDSSTTMLESMAYGSNFGILNWDSPIRLSGNVNSCSPDVSLASTSLIISTNWQTRTNLSAYHLPILISL